MPTSGNRSLKESDGIGIAAEDSSELAAPVNAESAEDKSTEGSACLTNT